jgi:hypothetical protein
MKKFAESEIQKMMKKLDLTREEAIQLLQDDEDDVSVELTAEQKKVVKKMTQGDRKKEDTPRKRERKIDENKRYLMAFFENVIKNNENIEDFLFTNVEREAVFKYKGETYRLTLAKPREKKSE